MVRAAAAGAGRGAGAPAGTAAAARTGNPHTGAQATLKASHQDILIPIHFAEDGTATRATPTAGL